MVIWRLSGAYCLARAGHWFLHSGIQEPSGGVARYFRLDIRQNKPVSTEITGYFASALTYLHSRTGEQPYLDAAQRAVDFLCDHAWDDALQTFPFEHQSDHAYFFDSGIIVRGLLAVWRITQEQRLLDLSVAASRGMIADFHSGVDYHPIVGLPDKASVARTAHWSKSPGCYQLKSALAWWEVAEITGEAPLREAYLEMVDRALASHGEFLPGSAVPGEVMDRLHPYCYFLEGLTPVLDRANCREAYQRGIDVVAGYLRDIAPAFVRSDVYAQLLRARLYGGQEPEGEADALKKFQVASEDARINGAFLFGRREDSLIPHANPVSTAFAIQALEGDTAFRII